MMRHLFSSLSLSTLACGIALLCPVTSLAESSFFTPVRHTSLRAAAAPIFINDPFISFWSTTDNLYDSPTCHWGGARKNINGLLRVDGTTYRFMGRERAHRFKSVVPMADEEAWTGKVTHTSPSSTDWIGMSFDDSSWEGQSAAWGTQDEYPDIRTSWTGENTDIYIRRHFTLTQSQVDELKAGKAYVLFSHDDKCEVYLNGRSVVSTEVTWIRRDNKELTTAQKQVLRVGDNVIAYHVHNTTGGSNADIGLFLDEGTSSGEIVNARQNGLPQVLATSTYYNFTCGPVNLDLVFTAPMVMDNLDLISTPVNYVSYRINSTDGNPHSVQLMFDTTPELATSSATEPALSRYATDTNHNYDYLYTGVIGQNQLGSTGDVVTLNWGCFYLPDVNGTVAMNDMNTVEAAFVGEGKLADNVGHRYTSNNESNMPELAYFHDFGTTAADSSFMMLAYDEVKDVRYLGQDYKGYWARSGKTITQAIAEYRDNYRDNMEKARNWDARIYDDALKAGNEKYAETLSACYRQVLGAHKLFQDKDGTLLYFSKEDNSGGFINTVDVFYPAAPLMLCYNTSLIKASLDGIFKYCDDSNRWGFPFPCHDLGIYPLAEGQRYAITHPGSNGDFGGNMPIEEAGNMVCLATMISLMDKDITWAASHWSDLTKWTDYLSENGQDPDDQLCTDDFAGRSRHNTNLSLKAIMGVAGYALMAKMRGGDSIASEYMSMARTMAAKWQNDAESGDHWKRVFNGDNTWSLKYNMVWDKVWGTQLFDSAKVVRELDYYVNNHTNKYGIPLDDRQDYTKSDWELWTGTMAPAKELFCQYSDMLWNYANSTSSRVPFSDWYYTTDGNWVSFRARPVVGGHWMRVLLDKYQSRKSGNGQVADSKTIAVENVRRAITLFDNMMSKCFNKTNLHLAMRYSPSTNAASGEVSIWEYTAAYEAACSILEGLEAIRDVDNQLYEAGHSRMVEMVANLFNGMQMFKGTYSLPSYTGVNRWSVYAVNRAADPSADNYKMNVYDDQMWITREDMRAYRLTGDDRYLTDAVNLSRYILDGWDCTLDANGNEYGGITWGPGYTSKHACSNGPIVSPLVWLAENYKNSIRKLQYYVLNSSETRESRSATRYNYFLSFARKIYDFHKTQFANAGNGLYWDMRGGVSGTWRTDTVDGVVYRRHVDLNGPSGETFTYNTGTMISGAADLYRETGDKQYLEDMKATIDNAVNGFTGTKAAGVSVLHPYHDKYGKTDIGNAWFNDVLIRSFIDAYEADSTVNTIGIDYAQKNLDYGYDNCLVGGLLPYNLIESTTDDIPLQQEMAFISVYAQLAKYQMHKSEKTTTGIAEVIKKKDRPSNRSVYNLSGMMISTDTNNFQNLPHGIYIVGGKKAVKQ